MARKTPTCSKCGSQHFNMHPCPTPVDYLRRSDAPEGFRVSGEWGVKTKSIPLVYTLPPIPSHGRLIGPDGSPHVPTIGDA